MSKTKDEKFIICAYETALQDGGLHELVNPFQVGESVGMSDKGVKAVCRLLVRANFIKFVSKDSIKLTNHGIKLAKSFF